MAVPEQEDRPRQEAQPIFRRQVSARFAAKNLIFTIDWGQKFSDNGKEQDTLPDFENPLPHSGASSGMLMGKAWYMEGYQMKNGHFVFYSTTVPEGTGPVARTKITGPVDGQEG